VLLFTDSYQEFHSAYDVTFAREQGFRGDLESHRFLKLSKPKIQAQQFRNRYVNRYGAFFTFNDGNTSFVFAGRFDDITMDRLSILIMQGELLILWIF
jgi:hypothetical protein